MNVDEVNRIERKLAELRAARATKAADAVCKEVSDMESSANSRQNIEAGAKTFSQSELSFRDFIKGIYDFISSHRLLVFVVSPIVLDLCLFLIGYSMEGNRFWPNTSQEYKDFWGSLLFPVALSAMTYIVLFGDSGNHPAKGNENAFGCALMIVFVPLLVIAYAVYRLVRLVLDAYSKSKKRPLHDQVQVTLEVRVKRLNELLNAGVISKNDYDEQLSRLIDKRGS